MGDDDTMRGSGPAGDGVAPAGSIDAEVASQPACWLRAAGLAAERRGPAAGPGERVAVTGCGTSWFIAQSYAALREASGQGETDAFAASEMPVRPALRPGRRAVAGPAPPPRSCNCWTGWPARCPPWRSPPTRRPRSPRRPTP